MSVNVERRNRVVWSWHDDRITGADQLRGASLQPGFVSGGGCATLTNTVATQGTVAFGMNVPTAIPNLVPWDRVAWLDYEGVGSDPSTGELWAAWADYRTSRTEAWPCNPPPSLCSYSLSDVQTANFFP